MSKQKIRQIRLNKKAEIAEINIGAQKRAQSNLFRGLARAVNSWQI